MPAVGRPVLVVRLSTSSNLIRRIPVAGTGQPDVTGTETAPVLVFLTFGDGPAPTLPSGSLQDKKALVEALVHGIRVTSRDHITPVFRVPKGQPSEQARELYRLVVVTVLNPNTHPAITGPTIRLPEPSGAGLRFRRRHT